MEEDRLYLKKFVQQHPDNKMGWYLLGKEYAAQGKEAKATYCFAQSGEVFEAFEAKKMKVKLPEHLHLDGAPNGEKSSARRRRLNAPLRIGLLLLMLALLSSVATAPTVMKRNQEKTPQTMLNALAEGKESAVYYTHPFSNPLERRNALQSIMFPKQSIWKYAVLVKGKLSDDGKWVIWPTKPIIELSSERSNVTGQPDVRYYDEATCNCKPEEGGKAQQTAAEWMAVEEELAILRSTMDSYAKQNGGALPDSIEQLTGDYPRNVLPGFTETMKQAYPALMAQFKQPKTGGTPSPQDGEGGAQQPASVQGSGVQGHNGNAPLQEKLEIIVDKEKHRLALVSGKIIIRNYPVGLGGSKTPEQTFVISEKVRNPNGRSNGDFGSRGMTLSDTLYAIHGTNDPSSIGKDKSLGCIRMLQEDVEELFDMVPTGTKVTIGQGGLPEETVPGPSRYRIEPVPVETNPNKVYRWLL